MNSNVTFDAPKVHKPTSKRINQSKLTQLIQTYQIPSISKNNDTSSSSRCSSNNSPKKPFRYDYGTAGFRYNHKLLPPIMVRMGMLASLRSSSLNGESVGIMITASHNPEIDNGVKLSDSNGGMMPPQWENLATIIANADMMKLSQWIDEEQKKQSRRMIVHVGRDTRNHSLFLSQLTIEAAVAMGAIVIDHGCVTTPQLHYFVLRSNAQNLPNALLAMSSGVGFERDYIEGIIGTYMTLVGTKSEEPNVNKMPGRRRKMLVDCACGVGGMKIPILNTMLHQCIKEGGFSPYVNHSILELVPFNLPGDGPLNEQCGAEFVQKQQKIPRIHSNKNDIPDDNKSMDYVASLDGDADRIVFHFKDGNGKLVLLDGDKIAVLVSSFIQEELDSLATVVPDAKKIRCGVVQTAYANGSSTNYLKVSDSHIPLVYINTDY